MIISKPATGPFTTVERWWIVTPVLVASLLHSLAMTTAYIALPNMKGNLAATPDTIGWVLTSFLVASAIGTAATGYVSNRFGRKKVFLAAIVGFTSTSLLCALAQTLETLVVIRVFQGLMSAPLLPLSQAIMLDTFPRKRHAVAMSIWSLAMIQGPVLGPPIGAYLVEFYDWRWIFYMNVPIGILSFIGCFMTLPETELRQQRMDWLGFGALAVGVAALQLLFDRGERLGWFESTEILMEAGIAATCTYIFLIHTATTRNPYISLAIFKDRNYVIGVFLIFLFGVNVFTTLLLIPLFLQDVQGYPVLTAGIIVATRGIGTAGGMWLTGKLGGSIARLRIMIVSSLMMISFAAATMASWTENTPVENVIVVNLIGGVGMGLIWVSINTATFTTLPAHLRTEGAALFALIRTIGASLGISIFVTLLARNTQINYFELIQNVHLYNELMPVLRGVEFGDTEMLTGLARVRALIDEQAQLIAFLNDFKLLMLTSLVGIPLVLLIRRPKSEIKPAE